MPQPRRTSFRGCLQQSLAQRRARKLPWRSSPLCLTGSCRFWKRRLRPWPRFSNGCRLDVADHHICRLAFSGRRPRVAEQVSQDQGFGGTNAGCTWSQRVLVAFEEFRRHLFLSASSRCGGVPGNTSRRGRHQAPHPTSQVGKFDDVLSRVIGARSPTFFDLSSSDRVEGRDRDVEVAKDTDIDIETDMDMDTDTDTDTDKHFNSDQKPQHRQRHLP